MLLCLCTSIQSIVRLAWDERRHEHAVAIAGVPEGPAAAGIRFEFLSEERMRQNVYPELFEVQ